jgi:caffeoyl-CoA O-methyltransferase
VPPWRRKDIQEDRPVRFNWLLVFAGITAAAVGGPAAARQGKASPLDATVTRFLDQHRGSWRDMNVPDADGKALYDLVLDNRAKRALEIGTSTGHSGIFIAWALSKTGGKLITIDIDEGRHREAVGHFKEAGVAAFIDARLADAHDLVPKLEGPFDFVFIDADKEWYTNYAKAVLPKLTVGGLLTAHNVSAYGGRRQMTGDFYEWIKSQPNLETSFRAGVMVAKKIR